MIHHTLVVKNKKVYQISILHYTSYTSSKKLAGISNFYITLTKLFQFRIDLEKKINIGSRVFNYTINNLVSIKYVDISMPNL